MKLPTPIKIGLSPSSVALLCPLLSLLMQVLVFGETPARKAGNASLPATITQKSLATTATPVPPHEGPYAWWEDAESATSSLGSADDMLPKRWKLFGSVSAGYEYDNNLTLDADQKTPSGFLSVSPTVGFKYGPMASGLSMDLIYTADLEWYLDNDAGDRVNHDLSTNFNWERGPFRFFGSLAYGSTAAADIDAGERVARDTVTTNLGVTYEHSEKTSLGLTYSTDIFSPEEDSYISSAAQTFGAFADYKITGKTSLGLGAQYSLQQVGKGSDSNAYRLLLRSTWTASPKLTINGEIGPEIREYTDDDSGMEAYWNIGIDYKLDLFNTGKTTFGFDVYRDQHASNSLLNQSYTSTGVSGSLEYNPTDNVSVNIATGYEFANYTGTSVEVNADRQDQLYFIRPTLTYAVNRRTSVSLYYQWSQNVSEGEQAVDFERSSYGALLTLSF